MSEYLRPSTLEDALAARAAHPEWTVLCGGTDLLVGALERSDPAGVLDLFGLAPITGVERSDDGGIRVGAATTYAELLRSELVRAELPALHACAREVGAVQIQARGTLGGNMVTSSPVGDTLPVLLALDAEVEVASAAGARRVPYHVFCTGYRQVDLAADELLVAIHFPAGCADLRQSWRKVGTRRAQAISKVMVAAAARLADGKIEHVRVALGAVADRPIRARAVEAALTGQAPSEALAAAAREALAGEITPISDLRSTKEYRLRVAQNLVARFVLELG